jgi:hypothetical protein
MTFSSMGNPWRRIFFQMGLGAGGPPALPTKAYMRSQKENRVKGKIYLTLPSLISKIVNQLIKKSYLSYLLLIFNANHYHIHKIHFHKTAITT